MIDVRLTAKTERRNPTFRDGHHKLSGVFGGGWSLLGWVALAASVDVPEVRR